MTLLQKNAPRRMFTVRRSLPGAKGNPLALRSWARRLARWKYLAAVIVLAGTAAALVHLATATPLYRTEAVLALDTRAGPRIGLAASPEEVRADAIAFWYTIVAEAERVQSWPVRRRLAHALSLEPDALGRPERAAPQASQGAASQGAAPSGGPVDDAQELSPRDVAVLRSMDGRLQAIGDRKTGTIRLVVTAADPALAARVANRWMEIALDDQVRRKRHEVEVALAATDGVRASLDASAAGTSDAVQGLTSWQKALQVQLDAQKPDFLVVSRAAPPLEPSSPRWLALLAVAVLGSLAVALAVVYLVDAVVTKHGGGRSA